MNESEKNKQELFGIKIEPSKRSPVYFSPYTTKVVFVGCHLDLLVRPTVESDQGRHFILFRFGDDVRFTVLKARIWKDSCLPIEVHYVRLSDQGEEVYPEVFMTGLFDATYHQAREMLTHAKEIRPYQPKGKRPTPVYKEYLKRWQAGETYQDLRAEWIEKNPGKNPKLFYRAFYRQDKDFFQKEPK